MDNGRTPRARGRDLKGEGYYYTGDSLRTRRRVREAFYDPPIARDLDAAVDFALAETHGEVRYRSLWCFYCLTLGINTFLDQLNDVMKWYGHGSIRVPASAFHARLKKMTTGRFGQIRQGGAR